DSGMKIPESKSVRKSDTRRGELWHESCRGLNWHESCRGMVWHGSCTELGLARKLHRSSLAWELQGARAFLWEKSCRLPKGSMLLKANRAPAVLASRRRSLAVLASPRGPRLAKEEPRGPRPSLAVLA